METIKLKDTEKVEYLIKKRDDKIEHLSELLKINDEKSQSIFNEIITLNKQLKLEEDLMIVKTLTSVNIL